MSWTNITKPSVGDPTKKAAFADALVDDLTFLYNQFLSVVGNREIILNGSFESDADGDSYPDGWTRTLYTGGSFTWDQSTVAADGKAYHGKRSVKFTSPGGASKGGGYITSESFFEVTEGRPYKIQFATKSSAADVHNTASISWYDSTQTLISTTTFHDDAATNPTSWETYEYQVTPPDNARYAKLIFRGCVDDDTTAGSTWYDDIRIASVVPPFERRCMFNVAGSYKWKCPTGVEHVAIICVGGGGGGGGSDSGNGAGGGGGGGLAYDIQSLTAGTSYAFTVGAGGAGGVGSNNGSAGGNSSFTGSATLTGNGGSGGVRASSGGTGGAGGSGSGGRVNTTGTTGATRSGTTGGDGGEQPEYGGYGLGGTANNNGNAGPGYGGGGGGSGSTGSSVNGGAGGVGLVLLLW
jgi:hypothetical protein